MNLQQLYKAVARPERTPSSRPQHEFWALWSLPNWRWKKWMISMAKAPHARAGKKQAHIESNKPNKGPVSWIIKRSQTGHMVRLNSTSDVAGGLKSASAYQAPEPSSPLSGSSLPFLFFLFFFLETQNQLNKTTWTIPVNCLAVHIFFYFLKFFDTREDGSQVSVT